MAAYDEDTGSTWSLRDQRDAWYMCPLAKRFHLERGFRNINQDTGAWEGPVTTQETADYQNIGSLADVIGSGLTLDSSYTGAMKVFSDDNGASIAASVRGMQSRLLLTVDQAGGSI